MEYWEVRLPLTGSMVHIQVLNLSGAAYVWLGTEEDKMERLAVVLQTQYAEMPSVAWVLGDEAKDYERLFQRICRKTGLVIHWSCNLAENLLSLEPDLPLLLERELLPKLLVSS